jgi:5'-3' exonuclease
MKDLFELEESNEPKGNNLLLVDLLNVCFRYQRRNNTDFTADLIRTLVSLSKSYSAPTVLLISDWKHSKYRRDLYPPYKQNRKAKYAKQSEEEKQQAAAFFEAYDRMLTIIEERFPLIRLEFVEADDVAAYVRKKYSSKFEHTWLISSDSDWDLMLDENTSRFSLVTRKEYDLHNFYDCHGCEDPEQYISQKVLAGDAKDGVEGIKDIGPGRAYKLIREYGSAVDLLGHLPLPGKLKTTININEQAEETIVRNCELLDLMTYCEDAIVAAGHDIEELDKELCQKLRI